MQTDGATKLSNIGCGPMRWLASFKALCAPLASPSFQLGHRQAIPDRRFVIELTLRQGMLIKLHRLHRPQLQYQAFFPHQQKRRAVGHQLDWQLGGAVLAGADALASHRVGAQNASAWLSFTRFTRCMRSKTSAWRGRQNRRATKSACRYCRLRVQTHG